MMAIGRNNSKEDIERLIKETKQQNLDNNPQGTGEPSLNYNEFLYLMSKEIKDSIIDEELIEAFLKFGATSVDGNITKQ